MKALELKIPPVVLVALFSVAMWGLAHVVAFLVLPAIFGVVLAGIFISAGAIIALMGVQAFRHANTTVDPRVPQQSSRLVASGIYRYSRNPMYLGFLLLLTGIACYLGNIAAFALLPLFVLYMNCFQIEPEERFLQQKFGAEYQVYLTQVRRWL